MPVRPSSSGVPRSGLGRFTDHDLVIPTAAGTLLRSDSPFMLITAVSRGIAAGLGGRVYGSGQARHPGGP